MYGSNSVKTILLVEDEALIAMNESMVLKNHGFEVITAYNAEKAIEMVKQKPVDLILMDIDLGKGKMDGTEAAEHILQGRDLPIIFCTGHSEKEYVDKVKKITGYGYILKNSGEFVLLESINMALTLYAAQRKLKEMDRTLRIEKNQFEKYLSVAGVMIVAINRDGIVTLVNERACDVLGYEKEEVLGKNWKENFIPERIKKEMNSFYQDLNSGKIDRVEYHVNNIKTKSGKERIISWHNTLIFNDDGTVTGHLCSGEDITDRMAEQHRFYTLMETSPTSIVFVDKSGGITYANKQAEIELGLTKDPEKAVQYNDPRWEITDLNGGPFPDEKLPFSIVRSTLKPVYNVRHVLSVRGGDPKVVSVNAAPLLDSHGNFDGMVAVINDISGLKQFQNALEKSEQQKKLILNSSAEMIAYYNTDLEVIWANKTSAESVGKDIDDLIGGHCYEIWHNRQEPCEDCPVLKAYREKKPCKAEQQTPDGRYWSLRGYPVFDDNRNVTALVEFGQDITEQRKNAEALQKSERKFRSLVEQAVEMLFLHDMEGNILDVNKAAEKSTGYSREELLQMTVFDIDPDAKERKDLERHWQTIDPESKPQRLEVRHRRKDGSIYDAEVILSKITMPEETFILGLAHDVTVRKKMEDKLRYEQGLMKTLLDNIPDLIYFKDRERRFVRVSKSYGDLVGMSNEELIGKTDYDIFSKDVADSLKEDDEQVIENGKPIINRDEGRNVINGKEHWLLATKVPWKDPQGETIGFFGISKDISDLKKTEQHLEQMVEEKDYLMKELNHRVKNNLLIISSLINLKMDSGGLNIDLSDLQHQIDAIRIVHEKLYNTNDTTHVNFAGYINDLLETVFSSFSSRKVAVINKCKDCSLPVKKVIPLGLIINEIATNAIKHGFTSEDERAEFTIDLQPDPEGGEKTSDYMLTLSNSGKPFPADVDFKNPDTLGLRLISALVDQLGGTIDLKREPHPEFTIRFPVE